MKSVWITFTNPQGVSVVREVFPLHIRFGTTKHHTTEQWVLVAIDVRDGKPKDVRMSNIHQWSTEPVVSFCGGHPPLQYEPQKMAWDWSDAPKEPS